MQVILIPGLWLGGESWHDVVPTIDDAGFDAVPLTLPSSPEAQLADWIAAVVARIDAAGEPVVLVGHSGGGNVAWGAADARPDGVSRVIFVDTVPVPDGADISAFPVVDGVVPFPGWEAFDAPDIADLDAGMRQRLAATAVPVPDPFRRTRFTCTTGAVTASPSPFSPTAPTPKNWTRSCQRGRAITMSGAQSPTARSRASGRATGRSSPSPDCWERSSCARSSADDQ